MLLPSHKNMTFVRRTRKTVGATAKLAGSILRGRIQPFSMTFILTNRCNFRCAYCNIPETAQGEMTQREFEAAIDEFADAGMLRASFSGGEALMRPDAPAIIRYAHDRGLHTSLNTNGWMVRRLLDETASALDMVMISLDGPEEIHDRVRKQKGSFARALESIRGARERGLAVTTITVLNHQNLHVVDDILELATEYGFWAYFQPAYDDCFDQNAGLDPTLTHHVLEDFSQRLKRARAAGQPVGASEGYLARLAQGPEFGDCSRCHAGRYFGTVMPDGRVIRCHLKEGTEPEINGLEMGFLNAFKMLGAPSQGPGCAISPYQELDLIFGLDHRAVKAALKRLKPRSSSPISMRVPVG